VRLPVPIGPNNPWPLGLGAHRDPMPSPLRGRVCCFGGFWYQVHLPVPIGPNSQWSLGLAVHQDTTGGQYEAVFLTENRAVLPYHKLIHFPLRMSNQSEFGTDMKHAVSSVCNTESTFYFKVVFSIRNCIIFPEPILNPPFCSHLHALRMEMPSARK